MLSRVSFTSSYFREIHQHLSHLITSLTTSDVDNDVTVGELGYRLTNDSLSASESTRYANCTSLDTGEKGV